jgi:hypothetical protein
MDSVAMDSGSSAPDLAHASRRVRSLALVLSTLFDALLKLDQDVRTRAECDSNLDATFADSVVDLLDEITETVGFMRLRLVHVEPPAAAAAIDVHRGDDAAMEPVAECADTLARAARDVDLEQVICDHQEAWDALVTAVRRRRVLPDGGADGEDTMERYSRVLAALPTDFRRDFRRLAESSAFLNIIERDAAFELGRHVERQATTVRREGIR